MSFIYFMNNPKGKSVGDCAIRALSVVLDMDWKDVYINLATEGLEEADLPNANAVWGKYLRNMGYRRHIIPNTCPECYTIREFCYDFPTGKYVVCTGNHVVAVISGNYYDAYDSGSEALQYYFMKEVY